MDDREGEGRVVVRGTPEGFAQEIFAGGHILRADEPASVGGTDTGPTPYDLLLAGLSACTSMTVGLYARRKKWPLTSVTIRAGHAKVHSTDCEGCEEKPLRLDQIELEIALAGDLTKEQRAKLFEIAKRCPVHRTLTSEMRIEARLVE